MTCQVTQNSKLWAHPFRVKQSLDDFCLLIWHQWCHLISIPCCQLMVEHMAKKITSHFAISISCCWFTVAHTADTTSPFHNCHLRLPWWICSWFCICALLVDCKIHIKNFDCCFSVLSLMKLFVICLLWPLEPKVRWGLFSLCFTILADNFQNEHPTEVNLFSTLKHLQLHWSHAVCVCLHLKVHSDLQKTSKKQSHLVLFLTLQKNQCFDGLSLSRVKHSWDSSRKATPPNTTVSTRHGLCRC